MSVFCVPVKKEKKRTWRIMEAETGRGVYGSVRGACRQLEDNEDCSYVIKIIPLSKRFTVRHFNREVKAQKILASKGLALEVVDHWMCSDKPTGVIIMRVLDATAEKFLTQMDSTIEDQISLIKAILNLLHALHNAGYYHGDTHLGNIMLKRVDRGSSEPHTFPSTLGTFRVYLVDMGKTGSLKRPGKFLGNPVTAQTRIKTDLDYVKSEFRTYAREATRVLAH